MLRFALRRLLVMGPLVFVVLTITFVMVQMAPGSPFSSQRRLLPEIEANLKAKYGFDQPKLTQYVRYMGRLVGFTYQRETGRWTWHPYPDFGDSTKYKDKTVNQIIKEALPVSAMLGLIAYLMAVIVGLAAGMLAAYKQNSWIDHTATGLSMLGVCIPNFVLGPLLVTMFSLTLYWFPPARMEWAAEWGYIRIPTLRSVALPAITLSAVYIAYIARLTRSGMVETLRQDYIRTARAKGLSEWRILLVHALRGGLLPVVSFSGPALAFLITGTVVVERVFSIPGLGGYFVDAANNRDHFLILGLTAFGAIALMIANLLVDMAYAWFDPRIRYA
jgi:oligopeptide transport system permease protein